jgi:hypothetical protein
MKTLLLGVISTLVAFGSTSALCQDDAAKTAQTYSYQSAQIQSQQMPAEAPGAAAPSADQLVVDARKHEETIHFYEILVISVVALLSLVASLSFLTRKGEYSSSDIVHATGLIFIVYGTVFLSLTASTDQQLTAAIGVLGAVAGYLFGKMRGDEK